MTKPTRTELKILEGCLQGTPIFSIKTDERKYRNTRTMGGARMRMLKRMILKGWLSNKFEITEEAKKIIKMNNLRKLKITKEELNAIEKIEEAINLLPKTLWIRAEQGKMSILKKKDGRRLVKDNCYDESQTVKSVVFQDIRIRT